jgi:tRNA A37 methylthiotransferase MiaB
MVEGKNNARQQWSARSSQNKVLNFSAPEGANPAIGSYVSVFVTGSFPNSLLGQMVI